MKSISLRTRILTLNLVASSLVLVGLFTYFEQIRQAKEKVDRSNSVASYVNKAALHFNEMTIGMRGFILDPTLTSEWQSKLKADANAVEAMRMAREISFNPSVTAFMDEIAKMDEKMDSLENEFGELVKAGNMKDAQKFYFTDYLPVRQKTDQILDRVRQQTQSDVKTYGERQADLIQKGSTWVAGGIFAILFFLLGVNQWISARLTRRIGQLSDDLGTSATSIELASKNTASASQLIATSATENASAITETLSVADAGRKEADRGRDVVSAMASSMREVFESNSRLESLIKVIEDIKSKTKVINDIVFETRLLAFNASIEAARAGSHGKGFAVVAEEVGKLASVSGKAAEEIHTLLEQSTQQVTEIVTTTSTRVGTARESSMQCEQVFNQMSICLNEINRAMQEMEKETHQNSASSEEMANQASKLAYEAKALSNLVIQIRGLVYGNGEGTPRTESPRKVIEKVNVERSSGPQATPRLKVVSSMPAGSSEGQYADEGNVGRDDVRWKIG